MTRWAEQVSPECVLPEYPRPQLRLIARSAGERVAEASGPVGELLALRIESPRLWSPDDPRLYDSGAVHTQLTDVELELNGYLSYDREVEKMDFARIAQAHRELLEKRR